MNKYPLPEGWHWEILSNICDIKGGKRVPAGNEFAKEKTPYPYIRVVDMQNNSIMIQELKYLTTEIQSKIRKYTISVNDVYISIAGTIGLAGTIPLELDGANLTENAAKLVIKNKTVLYRDYLALFLNSAEGQKYIRMRINLVGQPKLALFRLGSILVPCPPLPEQHRIAAKIQELMQDVEHARAACEKQIEAAKALPSVYFREVFESEEAKKWERKKLGEVCDYDSGIWGDESDGSSLCHPILRSSNIRRGKMDFNDIAIRKVHPRFIETKKLKTGDILVTTSSGSRDLLGKSAIFIQPSEGRRYLFSNFTMRLTPRSAIIEQYYLYFYLQSTVAKEILKKHQDTTTGLRNLDKKAFLAQSIPYPPMATQIDVVNNRRYPRLKPWHFLKFKLRLT